MSSPLSSIPPSARESKKESAGTNPDLTAESRALPYRFPSGIVVWILAKLAAVVLWLIDCHTGAVVAYLIPDPWLLWHIVVPRGRGFGPVVSTFRTSARAVWLTIDDGPDPVTTPRVLDLLDRHRARATFFVIGENVRRYPDLAREISRRGHSIANHTGSHPAHALWRAGPTRFAREVDDCSRALSEAGVPAAPYFRPPVGIKNPFMHALLARRGLTMIAWSARGFDSVLPEATATKRIMKQITPGAIVLAHEGRGDLSRVRVLEQVLVGLAEREYTTVLPGRDNLIS